MQCNDELDLRKKNKENVIHLLDYHKFEKINNDEEYKYLRNMSIDSVIEENITKLKKERDEKIKEFDELKNKSIKQIWLEELDILEKEYIMYIKERNK
jgi:DNA topoisomerase-2